jgi:hypothetical protein
MNWKELKDFANSLTDEQLGQPVHVCGEKFSKKVTSTMILEEDYINPSGDGAEPKSVYADDEDFNIESEPVVAEKGEIWLNAE